MASCNVHNIRFYNVTPRAIHCMSYEPQHRKLALSRSDSSIEIWDLTSTPHLQKTIPGPKNGSVESMVWCEKRLFTCGLHGYVSEQDLLHLRELHSSRVTAGSAWCLGINKAKTHVAVGTEDGYINIFSILEDGLQYEKLLDKQEGRILSLAWNFTGDSIATGSIDAIRVWNVNTGHAVHKMTTGRSSKNKETIVWCIAVTSDFTIISGDSRGKITFWDGNMGVSMETYQSHKADVLCLTLSEDQNTLYCSGVDSTIVSFQRNSDKNTDLSPNYKRGGQMNGQWYKANDQFTPQAKDRPRSQWSRSHQRKVCDHDVRALAVCGRKLFSGGVDSYLTASYVPKCVNKYPPLLQAPCAQLCPQSRRVLLRFPTHLQMWSLGSTSNICGVNRSTFPDSPDSNPSIALPLKCDPIKLVELHSIRNESIISAGATSDAAWLCYSTSSITRLYHVTEVQCIPKLDKAPLPLTDDVAMAMTFSSDSSLLVLFTRSGRLLVLGLSVDGGPEVSIISEHQPHEKRYLTDAVHLLAISKCNKYIVAGDHDSNIAVWKGDDYYCSLPKAKSHPTALAIDPKSNNVVVIYADHKVQCIPKLDKAPLPLTDDVAMAMTFSSDSSLLVLFTRSGRLLVLGLSVDGGPEVSIISEHQPHEKRYLTDAVHLLAISKCNKYIVAGDHDSNIAVWKGDDYYCSLPKAKSHPTALAIDPKSNNVVVIYADHKLVEYSLSQRSFTEFSRRWSIPETWQSSPFVAINITFDPRNPDVIVFHSDVSICVINRTETVDDRSSKMRRTHRPSRKYAHNMIKKYKHLVVFDWICDDEVAAVEVNPETFSSQLPPPLKVKRFGIM